MKVVLLLLTASAVCQALAPSTYIHEDDVKRLETLFSSQITQRKDLQSVSLSIQGLTQLGKPLPKSEDACDYLKKSVDVNDISTIYYATQGAAALKNCKVNVPKELLKSLEDRIADKSVQDIFYIVEIFTAVGHAVNSKNVNQALQTALKKDDGVLSLGYTFHVAARLVGDVTPFLDRIEDAVVQADEVDGKYLQYEGGVGITSIILTGIYRLSEKTNKRPPITDEQAIKFSDYLVNRKTIQSVKGAYHLITGLNMFSTNKFQVPVVTSLVSPAALSEARPDVRVRVTDMMGRTLSGSLSVLAESVTRQQDDAVIISKQPFSPSKNDKSVYDMNLMSSSPGRGFYTIIVSAKQSKPDPRHIGNQAAQIRVKVLTQVSVENVEIGVSDTDESTAPQTDKVVQHSKLGKVLEADQHQRVNLQFKLMDRAAGVPIRCQQAFVRLVHAQTGRELLFVAEPDQQLNYKFEMLVRAQSKRFRSVSGVYRLELIVGDTSIDNSLSWTVADVRLKFAEDAQPEPADLYASQPDIKHTFRVAESRPPASISTLFTILLAAPVLVMLFIWMRIGINVSNFPISLSSVGFMAGIGGIFVLYFYFWLKLNMFATVKYLFALAVVTFLCGHDTLSRLAERRKTQRS